MPIYCLIAGLVCCGSEPFTYSLSIVIFLLTFGSSELKNSSYIHFPEARVTK